MAIRITQYAPELVFCPLSEQPEGQRVFGGRKFCAACGATDSDDHPVVGP